MPGLADRRPSGARLVEDAQRKLAAAPDDPGAMTHLASAYLLRARETGDPGYYTRADGLLLRANDSRPGNVDTLVSLSSLAAVRHEFEEAAAWAEQAVTSGPRRPAAWGALTDALVELGRYDAAADAAQRMVDLRPDQASFSRVSYLRELHGDLPGATVAMNDAVEAGAPFSEATAWSEVQLGHLYFAHGDARAAERAYESAARRIDGYPHARAGLARVRVAQADLAGAARLYEQAAATLPIPEFIIALGEVYELLGDDVRSAQQYELVGAMQRLMAAEGVRTDLDLALFRADHDLDSAGALEAARAEYAVRPNVIVASSLAWIEYKHGLLESARQHSAESLRLGTQDPLLLYRAGVIAQESGDLRLGHDLLRRSSELNPSFSVRFAPDLSARLQTLGQREQS
jgi:tetratricopeptide (TPR) repeat protein